MSDYDLQSLLQFTCQNGASDLHLSVGVPPMVRIDGDLRKMDLPVLTEEKLKAMIVTVMNKEQLEYFTETLESDFSVSVPDLSRFRVNCFYQNRGVAAVFRVIPSSPVTLEDLNAPEIFKEMVNVSRGLILVTGATGSGKSTTLAAMVDYLNKTRESHILTIEDPIEFVHQSQRCLVNQREVHKDTHSFANALRGALREDPDIILVGEMRDLETIQLAISAAETGHLVFGTLHTSSAPKTIDRIIDVFSAEDKGVIRSMLSESLRAVVSQTLLKKKGGGRVAGHEILIGTSAIKNLIREDKIAQMYSVLQTGTRYGMQTMDQDLRKLVQQGIVEKEEALPKAQDKNIFNS